MKRPATFVKIKSRQTPPPYSVRPLSKYETLLMIGVPWGIASTPQNTPPKAYLTTRNHNGKCLKNKYLLQCSQIEIAANRRVCSVGKRTYSVRPPGLSDYQSSDIKTNRSATNFLTLAHFKNQSITEINWGKHYGKDQH